MPSVRVNERETFFPHSNCVFYSFHLSLLKKLFHCFLATFVAVEKYEVSLIVWAFCFKVKCLFCWFDFCFHLPLMTSCTSMTCLGMAFLNLFFLVPLREFMSLIKSNINMPLSFFFLVTLFIEYLFPFSLSTYLYLWI